MFINLNKFQIDTGACVLLCYVGLDVGTHHYTQRLSLTDTRRSHIEVHLSASWWLLIKNRQ